MLEAVKRRDAALRGAVTALLWSAASVALLASIAVAALARRSARGNFEEFAGVLLDNMQGAGPFAVTMAVLVVSAMAGGVMGLLARRLRGTVAWRCGFLILAAVPVLWLVVAGAWALAWLPKVIAEQPRALVWMPVGALWFSGIGIVVAAPALLLPTALAAVTLEGWTRPDTLPQTGLARPGLRRRVLLVLVVLVAALTTFAALNWSRVPLKSVAVSVRSEVPSN